jgi:coiled-coil domain-containing protein 6
VRSPFSKLDRAVKQDKIIVERLTAQLQQASEEKSKMQTTLRTEESLLTQMQAKLSKLGKEKVEIENQLEAEQEYVTNRLQKQLEHVEREKRSDSCPS